jgi:5'-methylthioadenosine phosphorylase
MKIAIIGGSGFENPDILKNGEEIHIKTPYGKPSSPLKTGTMAGVETVVLSRYGHDHGIPPSRVNNRANIWALHALGCSHIIATTACGSLREQIKRGDLVILDQLIDFTRHREVTFYEKFEKGVLGHVAMADPFDAGLRENLIGAAERLNLSFHRQGTLITIEGPRFSTRAESHMFRLWGADVINMSVAPECILSNELGMPYGAVALSTDYDSWKTGEEAVTWEEVLKVFNQNVRNVIRLLQETLSGYRTSDGKRVV